MKNQKHVTQGIIIGSGIGVVIGVLTDHIGLGISIGTALGIIISSAIKEMKSKKD